MRRILRIEKKKVRMMQSMARGAKMVTQRGLFEEGVLRNEKPRPITATTSKTQIKKK